MTFRLHRTMFQPLITIKVKDKLYILSECHAVLHSQVLPKYISDNFRIFITTQDYSVLY